MGRRDPHAGDLVATVEEDPACEGSHNQRARHYYEGERFRDHWSFKEGVAGKLSVWTAGGGQSSVAGHNTVVFNIHRTDTTASNQLHRSAQLMFTNRNTIAYGKKTAVPVELQVALQLSESLFTAERWQMLPYKECRALDRIKR